MASANVAVGLAIPPKPPLGALKQVIWASRIMRFDCLMLWDHLQDIFPESMWEKSFTWSAGETKHPHEFFDYQTMLGYMAAKAGRLTLGVAVTEPIRRHPVVIAQHAVTLAHLSKRAPILGIGSGEAENVVPYGMSMARAVSRLDEALQVIRLCLDNSGGPLNFTGDFYSLSNATFDLTPPKNRKPRVWVGALGPRMLELTGKYGDGWYPIGLLTPAEYGERLEIIRAAAKSAGRQPDAITPSLQPYMVVAPTTEEAERMLEAPVVKFFGLLAPASIWQERGHQHPLGPDFRGITDWLPEEHSKAFLQEAIAAVPKEIATAGALVGSPKDIAMQLRAYRDAGMRHVVPQAMSAAISKKHALYSLRALRSIRAALNS